MNKTMIAILVLILVLTAGCAAKRPASRAVGAPATTTVQTPAATSIMATADAVSGVESDIDSIDTIDADTSDKDLDNLDSELNFEI